MKLTQTISKNLKLLFRSKESAYTIIFGPILIILLVSFALFGSSDEYTVRVGTYSPAQTGFSIRTIDALNEKNYLVSVYGDQESCIDGVKTGSVHACMVFSKEEAGNGTIPVTFYLDLSRTNIIYQISDDLEGELDLQADEIRTQLASDALARMQTAATLVDRNLNTTEKVLNRFTEIQSQLSTARAAISKLSNETPNASLQGLRGFQLGLAQNTRHVVQISDESLGKAADLIGELTAECDDCSAEFLERIEKVEEDIEATRDEMLQVSEETVKDQLFEADLMLQYAIEDLEMLKSSLENDTIAKKIIAQNVLLASNGGDVNARELKTVTTSLRYTRDFLNGNTVDAEDISTPISTSIVSITASEDRLSFTYPYLLVLVIMFIGMLLASMLVVADKTSRAAFRNFTTPTSDGYHIVVSFITAFLLLVAEVAVILILSSIFVAQPLLLNTSSTLVLITITIVLFTFIGMIIGYLSTTQEAAMIASISIGSILLFVSNLIIPVEGMAAITQGLTKINPYLVLSELLKKSMLYGVSMEQVSRELFALVIASILLLALTILIHRRIKRSYFRQEGILAPHIPAPLALGNTVVHTEVELLDALDRMTRAEFERLVPTEDNIVSNWAAKELRNKRLAKKLRTTSKEKMILRLDAYLKKHGKHLKR